MPKKSSNKSTSFSPRFVAGTKSQKWINKGVADAEKLNKKLNLHKHAAVEKFQKNHPHADQWFKARSLDIGQIREHSQKLLTGAGLSAAMLLSAPTSPQALPQPTLHARLAKSGITSISKVAQDFLTQITPDIPQLIGHLDPVTEAKVSAFIKQYFTITASSTLEGQRLNHSLGWMGYEQHLKRFPGDSLGQHDEEQRAGVAPGLGAWGFFASSKSELSQSLIQHEKYYVAVQTLYIPTWQKDLKFLREWYKYRKVIVINIDNGTAVVAVIGDAGPAAWTGKQFGGSPEVMRALDLTGKKSKGKVLLYFVNDPNNQVPLGPIKGSIDQNIKLT